MRTDDVLTLRSSTCGQGARLQPARAHV